MEIPGFVNPKVTSKPSSSGVHATVETWGGDSIPAWEGNGTLPSPWLED